MWVLCNNSAFDLEQRKTTNKFDLIGRFQKLSDAYSILEKGPALKFKNTNGSPNTCTFLSMWNKESNEE